MKLLYTCTQVPGHGGASTEAYATIKCLRHYKHDVTGLFLVNKGQTGFCDPDGIGNIRTTIFKEVNERDYKGEFDIIVSKAPELPMLARKYGKAKAYVYIPSGIFYLTHKRIEASKFAKQLPSSCLDIKAFEASDAVICHSSIDYEIFARALPMDLFKKIVAVIHTPNLVIYDT